jgi:hypothetical protein
VHIGRLDVHLAMGEAPCRLIREHIVHVSVADARLVSLPVRGVEQVGVVRHEHLAHRRVAQQEGAEVSGKTSRGPTAYQISPESSSSSSRGGGTRRKLQSVTYSISS